MSLTDDSAIFTRTLDIGGDGLRVAIKDCLDIAGFPTGCGSAAFDGAAPAKANAAVVDAVLRAGCRIVGKANMHELAYGVTGINAHTGTPRNPRFPERIVGGSSSGSAAAVAAGLVDFAIGTDTGGSIRLPAGCCGVFGFKPTFGAISREGATPASSSLDCIGPFARDMAMIERAMAAMCPGFAPAIAPARVTLGRVRTGADGDVDAAVDAVMARSGVAVVSVELPSLALAHKAGITVIAAEMAPLFAHLVGTGLLGADVDARLAAASRVSADQVAEAEGVRARFIAEIDAALATVDALVLPTLPTVPIRVADAADAAAALRLSELVRPFNLSGHPALSLPTLTADGLPAGVQIVGRRNADAALCAIGRVLEAAL